MDTASQPLTVLVVDDNHKIRGIIRKILEPVGCRVLDTGEEEEAVELYRRSYGSVNVLLLDVSMSPGRGARYVLDELGGILGGVRVILVTGDEPRSVQAAFGEHEITGTLQKPFSIAALLDVVAPDPPGPPPSSGATVP
jgi:CheY-like chemotaxis protein